jgi:hypothetical protein
MVSDDPESFADLDGHDDGLLDDLKTFAWTAAKTWVSDNFGGYCGQLASLFQRNSDSPQEIWPRSTLVQQRWKQELLA